MARIKIEASAALVLLVCQDCAGVWRACAWSMDEAHDSALAHEQRTHPGTQHAYKARNRWLNDDRREAATRR